MLNLLSNAVKYTPEGGAVSLDTAIDPLPDGRVRLMIGVRDNGVGMSEGFQEHMFEPFTQDDDSSVPLLTEKGTGLGLAIVQRIVALMGGTIEVESALGQGSTFFVSIPVERAKDDERTAYERRRHAEPPVSSGLHRVLLAEDHPINAEIAIRMLESHGIEVTSVANGEDAVSTFAASEPGYFDAVLMDIQMPRMNGYDATRGIRALKRPDASTVRIVAMTADAFSEDKQRAREAGMDGHVAKPVDARSLLATLSGREPDAF